MVTSKIHPTVMTTLLATPMVFNQVGTTSMAPTIAIPTIAIPTIAIPTIAIPTIAIPTIAIPTIAIAMVATIVGSMLDIFVSKCHP